MKVREIVDALSLKVLAGAGVLEREVTGGYASDMLSLVMAGARPGNVWVTMQGHPNVAAVASLLSLAAVVITEGSPVDPVTLQRAEENGVPVLAAPADTFSTVAKLAAMGIRGASDRPEA
ncbi:MAG: DRTGG domain-containing protein [bacterium]